MALLFATCFTQPGPQAIPFRNLRTARFFCLAVLYRVRSNPLLQPRSIVIFGGYWSIGSKTGRSGYCALGSEQEETVSSLMTVTLVSFWGRGNEWLELWAQMGLLIGSQGLQVPRTDLGLSQSRKVSAY